MQGSLHFLNYDFLFQSLFFNLMDDNLNIRVAFSIIHRLLPHLKCLFIDDDKEFLLYVLN